MPDLVGLEIEASSRFTKLLQEARDLRGFYERSRLAVPDALLRLFGETSPVHRREPAPVRMTIPPPPRPDAPEGARDAWIWVAEAEGAVISLVLAVLRASKEPISTAEIFDSLPRVRDSINKGSVANLGTRLLKEGVISRSKDGWVLLQMDRAPIAYKGHLWGPPAIFEKSELAAHRRSVVKHILRSSPDGLQPMQLTKTLAESCPWFSPEIPMSKDLLKLDIKELEAQRAVRRKGTSGKWELTP